MNDYILLYSDEFYENNNQSIIKLLLKSEKKECKNKNNIIEIYPDNCIEDILIKDCKYVLYISNIYRSSQLLNLLEEYNKLVIFSIPILNINIYDIKIQLDKFKLFYDKLKINKMNTFSKNIRIKCKKLRESNKINIITYFNYTENKMLNVIQKKCIIENLKNKNVEKVIVLGKNLVNIFNDLMSEYYNLFLINDKNPSFKDLLEISNKLLINRNICILRSDIILPNQDNLDYLDYLDNSNNSNNIIALSRLERLITGVLIRTDKLTQILYSTEQDAWLFKSPLNIDINLLSNIFFYDKYSELFFNKILKTNGYNIINDTKRYKILRLLYENNVFNKFLINKNLKIQNNNDIFLLPENELIDKLSFEQLFNITDIHIHQLDSQKIYKIKCKLFNKYFKNKIIEKYII